MTSPYLDLAHQGKNDWWRYALALVILVLLWLMVDAMPSLVTAIIASLDGNPLTGFDPARREFVGVDPLLPFLVWPPSFGLLLGGLYLSVRFIHQRSFSSLITPTAFNWTQLAQAFGLWFLLVAGLALAEALFYFRLYQLTFEPLRFILLLILGTMLIPFQATVEELFFRGYLLQGAGVFVKNPLALSLLSGLMFMLPHFGNPESNMSILLLPIFYFGLGAFLAFITLKSNGLELALGVHAAHSLFTAIFVNYRGSIFVTPAFFTTAEFNLAFNLFGVLVAMVVFYFWFFWPEQKSTS